MKIAELYDLYKKYPAITTDSRICIGGSIFFALKGENFNGNEFTSLALERGCAYAVVDELPEGVVDERIILTDDVISTLQKLANYHRKKLKIPIIGITGTNGKTTTKELVAAILAKEFRVAFSQGNLNNHLGVPLTLLSMTKSHEIGVVEMGANHLGEIKILCEIAEPNFGLITNIGKAHIEGFGSYENIRATKGELYDFIREKQGKVFVNNDNKELCDMSDGMDRILYGKDNRELFASGHISTNNPFLEFDWNFFEHTHHVKTMLVGEYNFDNALAAIAIGKYFGINASYISNALEEYEPKNNRSQFERTEKNDLVIDTYNANPTSMKAALDFFVKIPSELPKAVIIGEMKELGSIAQEEHKLLVEYLSKQNFKKIYLVGDIFKEMGSSFPQFDTVADLIDELQKEPIKNHYIMIKGSHSVHLEKTIPFL